MVQALVALTDDMQRLAEEIRRVPPPPQQRTDVVQLPQWMVNLAGGLMLVFLLTLLVTIAEVRSITDTRFTREDGERLRREIQMMIQPSPDVLRRLTDHERRLEDIERR